MLQKQTNKQTAERQITITIPSMFHELDIQDAANSSTWYINLPPDLHAGSFGPALYLNIHFFLLAKLITGSTS